jgi:hypothetical protein
MSNDYLTDDEGLILSEDGGEIFFGLTSPPSQGNYLTDDEGLFLNEDGSEIFFGLGLPSNSESLHFIRNEIHSCENITQLNSGNFVERIFDFSSVYTTGNSQNYHMYIHAMQEYNRKLDNFGGEITGPVDAGFRPIDFLAFFGDIPTSGLVDFLQSQDNNLILQQNSFKLILEQDV